MNPVYKILLSLNDLIAFIAGLIVSGFVVEIFLFENFNTLHWITIICGLLFGMASFILSKIKKKFEKYIIQNKSIKPKDTEDEINGESWKNLNNVDNKENKILFGKISNFWINIILPILIGAPMLGIWFFNCANAQIEEENLQKHNTYIEQLIFDIKQVNNHLIDSLFIEKQSILDSLQQKTEKINILEFKVDSFNNVIKKLKLTKKQLPKANG